MSENQFFVFLFVQAGPCVNELILTKVAVDFFEERYLVLSIMLYISGNLKNPIK